MSLVPRPKLATPWPVRKSSLGPTPAEIIEGVCRRHGITSSELLEWATGEVPCDFTKGDWANAVIYEFGIATASGSWFEVLYKLLYEWENSGKIIPGKRMVLIEKRPIQIT